MVCLCSCSVLDRRGILQQEESTAQEGSCPRGPGTQEPPATQGPGQAQEGGTKQQDGSILPPSAVSDPIGSWEGSGRVEESRECDLGRTKLHEGPCERLLLKSLFALTLETSVLVSLDFLKGHHSWLLFWRSVLP